MSHLFDLHVAKDFGGFVVERDMKRWLMHHPYGSKYDFHIGLFYASSSFAPGDVCAYMVIGFGKLHSTGNRVEVLQAVYDCGYENMRSSLLKGGSSFAVEHSADYVRWPVCDAKHENLLRALLLQVGFEVNWTFDILVKILDRHLVSKKDAMLKAWKFFAIDYF